MNFKEYFSYFGDIGSKKFPKTSYVKSVVSSENNALHFYQLGMAYALVHAINVHDVITIGVGISRWCHHVHFLFTLLTYQASTHGEPGDFGIMK